MKSDEYANILYLLCIMYDTPMYTHPPTHYYICIYIRGIYTSTSYFYALYYILKLYCTVIYDICISYSYANFLRMAYIGTHLNKSIHSTTKKKNTHSRFHLGFEACHDETILSKLIEGGLLFNDIELNSEPVAKVFVRRSRTLSIFSRSLISEYVPTS